MNGPGRYIKTLATLLVGILVIGYAYFQVVRVLHGAVLTIQEPPSGATFTRPLIRVAGQARRVAFISLNDRQIFTDESGRFNEELLLAEGYNVFTLRTKDPFGAVREETREVVYRRPE